MVASYDLAEEGGVKKHAVHLAAKLRAGGDHVDLAGHIPMWECTGETTLALRSFLEGKQ